MAKSVHRSKANEAYVADGYFNKRVAVIDMDSGKIKRYWGGYGEKPDDETLPPYNPKARPSRQFRTPVHCAEVSNDGFVYVCDRPNDRIQVFTKEGKFVKEKQLFPETLSDGSVWDIAFSRDPQQKFLYMADGANEHVYIVDRQSLEVLTQLRHGGRQPGMFFGVHSIATDSKGNIYTTETYTGKRLQKFVYKGMGPAQTDRGPGDTVAGKTGYVGRPTACRRNGTRLRQVDRFDRSTYRPVGRLSGLVGRRSRCRPAKTYGKTAAAPRQQTTCARLTRALGQSGKYRVALSGSTADAGSARSTIDFAKGAVNGSFLGKRSGDGSEVGRDLRLAPCSHFR